MMRGERGLMLRFTNKLAAVDSMKPGAVRSTLTFVRDSLIARVSKRVKDGLEQRERLRAGISQLSPDKKIQFFSISSNDVFELRETGWRRVGSLVGVFESVEEASAQYGEKSIIPGWVSVIGGVFERDGGTRTFMAGTQSSKVLIYNENC